LALAVICRHMVESAPLIGWPDSTTARCAAEAEKSFEVLLTMDSNMASTEPFRLQIAVSH